MKKPTEYMLEQQIFLGGQVSHKHKAYQELAQLSPDFAEVYYLLKNMDRWDKEKDDTLVILEILELLGRIDFIRQTDELTKLSMILGDTRTRTNVKRVMDELRTTRPNP